MRTLTCLLLDWKCGPVRLDPRAPLVLDTRELGRRPGAERTVGVTAPAPADLGIEVVGVPEGAPVTFDLRLEATKECSGLVARKTVSTGARLRFICAI